MRMTYASFMIFLLKVDKSIKKHLSPWWKGKGCHKNNNKMVPRQRSSSGNSIEIPMQRRSVRMRAKDGGALPDTGCPTSWRQGNKWQFEQGANTSISNIASIHSRTSSRGYTFEACVIGGVRVRCSVGEVDVLGTPTEVVVHVRRCSGSWHGTWRPRGLQRWSWYMFRRRYGSIVVLVHLVGRTRRC